MPDLWISQDSGRCPEELENILQTFEYENACALAFYSHGFQAAIGTYLPKLLEDRAHLLELRVFQPKRELWMHRSSLGDKFSWRVADDHYLEQQATNVEKIPFPEFRDPNSHHFKSRQVLDINEKYPPFDQGSEYNEKDYRNEIGSLELHTIGGGKYNLPIQRGQRCVKIVTYVRYDEKGIATAVDYRLAGFEALKEGSVS